MGWVEENENQEKSHPTLSASEIKVIQPSHDPICNRYAVYYFSNIAWWSVTVVTFWCLCFALSRKSFHPPYSHDLCPSHRPPIDAKLNESRGRKSGIGEIGRLTIAGTLVRRGAFLEVQEQASTKLELRDGDPIGSCISAGAAARPR